MFFGDNDLSNHALADPIPEIPQFVAFGQQLKSNHAPKGTFFGDSIIEKLREVNMQSYRNSPAYFCYKSAVFTCIDYIFVRFPCEL